MESPAAAHSASPAELAAAARGRARGPARSCSGATPEGQRILALDQGRSGSRSGAGPRSTSRLDADEQVSRLHAEIERIGGEWTVADDGLSRNGSFLNGERVGGRRRLADGDELRFGATMVVFRAPQPSPSSATIAAPGGRRAPELTDTQRRILVALSRPFRDGSHYATPATNQQIADEVLLSRRLGQGPPAGAVREVRDRRPAAEPEAGAAGRARPAPRRDLGPRPRMSDGRGATGPAAGGRVRRPPDRGRDRRGRHGGRLPRPQPRPRPRAGAQGAEPGPLGRRPLPRALPARVAARRLDRAPERDPGPPGGRGGRPPLPRRCGWSRAATCARW